MASALPQQPAIDMTKLKGMLGALGAGVNPNAFRFAKPPPAPQIAMPQPLQMTRAQALAQIMARLNNQKTLQPGMPQS